MMNQLQFMENTDTYLQGLKKEVICTGKTTLVLIFRAGGQKHRYLKNLIKKIIHTFSIEEKRFYYTFFVKSMVLFGHIDTNESKLISLKLLKVKTG